MNARNHNTASKHPRVSRPRARSVATHGGVRRKVLIALGAVALVAVLAWVFIVPAVVRQRVTARTGCPVEAADISVSPFGRVRLNEFQLRNPDGFPIPDFVDLKVVDVSVKPFSLAGERIEVPRAVIDLQKLTLVTGRDGLTNAEAMRRHVAQTAEPESAGLVAEDEPVQYHIGELVVRLGTIEWVDYSRGGAGAEPVRRSFALNTEHRFTNVTDLSTIARPLAVDLARAHAADFLGTIGGALPGPFRDALGDAGGILGEGGKKAGDAVKKLIDSVLPPR